MPNGTEAATMKNDQEIARELNKETNAARGEQKESAEIKELKRERQRLDTALKVVTGVKIDLSLIMKFDAGLDTIEVLDFGTIIAFLLIPFKIGIFIMKLKNIIGGLTSGAKIIVEIRAKSLLTYLIAFLLELIPLINALPIAFGADLWVNQIYSKAISDLQKQISSIDELIKKQGA